MIMFSRSAPVAGLNLAKSALPSKAVACASSPQHYRPQPRHSAVLGDSLAL